MSKITPSTQNSQPKKKGTETKPAVEDKATTTPATPAPVAKKKSLKPGKKTHQKKGSQETIPSSLRLDHPGFAALRALETEMPDQTRVQIVSNALKAMAGQTALLTPIHLRRLSKDDLLLLSGQIADSETMLKEILRKIIRAKIEPVKKAELVDELLSEIKKQQELRRQVCRMTAIPITHELPAQVRISITGLMKLLLESKSVSEREAYEAGIKVLSAYTEVDEDLAALTP